MKPAFSLLAGGAIGIGLLALPVLSAQAEDHSPPAVAAEVDRLLAAELFGNMPGTATLARRAGDEVFLRRVYLDVVGQLPPPGEVTTFVLDTSPDKRARTTSRLLGDARYGTNWGRYWRDVILYRRVADEVLALITVPLEAYFTDRLNSNTRWNVVARECIEAEGTVAEHGEAALFMAQLANPVDVAAETARIFLGIQIQCAQCHDHPTDRWKRQQFHEFAAFFPRAGISRGRTATNQPSIAIVASDNGPLTRPPGGFRQGAREHFMPDLKDPTSDGTLVAPVFFATGQRLQTGTIDALRRGALADWLTSPENPWFARALVNRMWSELVGEGFVEPVDDMGPDRTASAPRAFEYLAEQFAAQGYDVKWLIQTIVQTEAYQRESRPRRQPDQPPFLANVPQRLRSDQLIDVLSAAVGYEIARDPRPEASMPQNAAFGPRAQLGQLFGYDPSVRRDAIVSSIPQALWMMNSGPIARSVLSSPPYSVVGKLLADGATDEDVIVELYLRCLAREPNDAELAVCLAHVRGGGRLGDGFEDVYWSLLNSEEIRYRP